MKILFTVALAGFLLTANARATTIAGQYVYFSTYHFTKVAFDKGAKSVIAHTGISIDPGCGQQGANTWDNLQLVTLKDMGDHFEGSAKLTTSASMCKKNNGPKVWYAVTFDDGTEIDTQETSIKVTETKYAGSSDTSRKVKEQEAAAETSTAISDTHAIMIDESFAD